MGKRVLEFGKRSHWLFVACERGVIDPPTLEGSSSTEISDRGHSRYDRLVRKNAIVRRVGPGFVGWLWVRADSMG